MGGNRARGALATLALASVVLVAVILAGTISMPPVDPQGVAGVSTERRDNSFGIVVPGEVSSPAPDDSQDPGGDPFERPESVVVLQDDPPADAGDPSGEPPGLPPSPVPPVITPDPRDPGTPDLPIDPPDPVDPVEPTDPPWPYEPQPSEGPSPDPTLGGPGKSGKPGKPNVKPRHPAGQPPVIIIGKGPRWRPPAPARQTHPIQPGKWTRAVPRSRPGGAVVKAKPPRPRAVIPPRPSVRNDSPRRPSNDHRGNGPKVRKAGKGHGRGHGHGGHGSSKGRGKRSGRGRR
jgi:hypothetical protein